MTPAEEAVSKITAPVDALLAQVVAAARRLEQRELERGDDLLRQVAQRIEAEPAFRASVIWLACD